MSETPMLITGLVFGESPRWHDDHLYCFDIATNEVYAVDLAGNAEVIGREATGIASMGFLDDLLLIAGRGGLVRRRHADGYFATYADLSCISEKQWNDMVVDGRGTSTFQAATSDPASSLWCCRRFRVLGRRRHRVRQRNGRNTRQLDVDSCGDLRTPADGLRYRH